MPAESSSHPDDRIVEAYALNRLEEPLLTAYEDHLLMCEECQKRLQQMDEYVDAMRRAARKWSS
jgi:hypothetical protein